MSNYTADSPAVLKALAFWNRSYGVPIGQAMAAVLSEHKRGLRERLTSTQAANRRIFARNGVLIAERDRLADEVDALKAAAIVLPSVEAIREVLLCVPGPGDFYTEAARAVLGLLDPRTIPAEPVDPDAAAVESMAAEVWDVIESYPNLDITFAAGSDADVDLCDLIARAALASYRKHLDASHANKKD